MGESVRDLAPIIAVFAFFQIVVLRQPIPNLLELAVGAVLVVLGLTFSTITIPLVTALRVGLASSIKERNPFTDGFGLIALASVFPIMSVLGYAQLTQWRARRGKRE